MEKHICAVVIYRENTLLVDMPRSTYDLLGKLQSIGVQINPQNILLADEDGDDLRVKLFGETEIGKHLVRMLNEQNSLSDANTLAFVYAQAEERVKRKLTESVLEDRYATPDDLYVDLKVMLLETEQDFYFPLTASFEDDGELYEATPEEIMRYSERIKAALEREQRPDRGGDMTQFLKDSAGIREKLLSATWDVVELRELYGVVHTRLKEPFTESETATFKDLIVGQNSDGLGEGFEQRPIYTENGALYVSMWNAGEDYFVYTDDEMDEYLQCHEQQMGGM